MGVIRPIACRQPLEAAIGIRVHPRLPEGCRTNDSSLLSYIMQPPELNSPQQSHADPNADGNHPGMTTKVLIRSLCCSSSSQVRHPFKMAPWELTEPAQFYLSLIHAFLVSVGLKVHCVFEWAFCQPTVCQRNDRCEIVLCCTSNQVHYLKEVVPWKLSGARSAFKYTHPTQETVTTKPAPRTRLTLGG